MTSMHTYINKIGEHVGESVTIKGWLHNRRSSGKIHFLVVRDGTGFLQVVMGKKDVDEATFQTADHLVPGKGVIDWDATTLAFQKVGYDGVWMFELAVAAEAKPVLEHAVKARERLESLLHIGDEMLGTDEP